MKNRQKGQTVEELRWRETMYRAVRIAGREHNANQGYVNQVMQNAIRSQLLDVIQDKTIFFAEKAG